QHRRRAAAGPAWKKWALIGGGAGAALLATVLVVALSGGGDSDKPDGPPDKPDPGQVNLNKDSKSTTTRPTPQTRLALAELPDLQLAPGSFKRFDIQVHGVNGAAG